MYVTAHAENKADTDRNEHQVTARGKHTSTMFIKVSCILDELHRFISCNKLSPKEYNRLEVAPVAYKVNYRVHDRESLKT